MKWSLEFFVLASKTSEAKHLMIIILNEISIYYRKLSFKSKMTMFCKKKKKPNKQNQKQKIQPKKQQQQQNKTKKTKKKTNKKTPPKSPIISRTDNTFAHMA